MSSSDFFEQLKLSLPDFEVIDLSSKSQFDISSTLFSIEQNSKLVGVAKKNPFNDELFRRLNGNVIRNPLSSEYLVFNGYFSRGFLEHDHLIIRSIQIWVRFINGDRTCLICSEKMHESVFLCYVCGDGPCMECSLKLSDRGDYNCTRCRTPFPGRLKHKKSRRKFPWCWSM